MPKRVRMFQACNAHKYVFEVVVRSNSDPEATYRVQGIFDKGRLTCECKSFKYRGTCKHTNLREEKCGWNAFDSKEAQTLDQEKKHACPRCGSKTVNVVKGGF